MNQFGTLLRFYREQCVDAGAAKGRLTQARLGELIGETLGMGGGGYTGAAVSEWERNRSQIHKDQRMVLIAILKTLYEQGGLKTAVEANRLLQAGNYRALDQAELSQIFPEIEDPEMEDPAPRFNEPGHLWRLVVILMTELTFNPLDSLRKLQDDIAQGPPPHWPRFALSVLGWPFNRWSSDDLLRAVAWLAVWLLTCWLILPSLTWPFADHAAAQSAMLLYVTGALLLPLFVGALTPTKNDPFWQECHEQSPSMIRLFTHQGAMVGFHVAYAFLLAATFIGYYVGFRHVPGWAQGAAVVGLLLISYAAARQTPLNLWRAFGDLRLRDGGVFFIFVGFGPLWAFFFLNYYPWLLASYGVALILAALGFLAALTSWQKRRSGSSVIPAHIWALIWAGVILPYTAVTTNLFATTLLAGVIGILIVLLAYDRIQGTFWGVLAALAAGVLLLWLLNWNLWVGRAATASIAVAWIWRGRGMFWLPLTFWGVLLTAVGSAFLLQNGALSEGQAALLFGTIAATIIGWEWRQALSKTPVA